MRVNPSPERPGPFRDAVRRGEVAYIYNQGCLPAYTISAVQLDEPPWDRYLG